MAVHFICVRNIIFIEFWSAHEMNSIFVNHCKAQKKKIISNIVAETKKKSGGDDYVT